MKSIEDRSLEDDLNILLEKSTQSPNLSIEEVLEILAGKGRLLILIFLSLPFCQPIQIPGLSTPFGIVIAIIGLRILFGKHIWLPKAILLKPISSTTIQIITQKSLDLMHKTKRFMHPRLEFLCEQKGVKIFNGLLIFYLGLFLALPLPIPLTNLVTGWTIFLLSLGLLENDGVFVLIGYLGSIITILFLILIFFSINHVL